MKNLIKFVLLLAFIAPLNGHAQGKRKKERMSKPEAAATVSATSDTKADDKTVYRLILSFISIGTGTDQVTREKVDSFIASHGKKPVVNKVAWGREGETDYCFTLKELSTDEQKTFIMDIKKLIVKPDLVQVKENVARN